MSIDHHTSTVAGAAAFERNRSGGHLGDEECPSAAELALEADGEYPATDDLDYIFGPLPADYYEHPF